MFLHQSTLELLDSKGNSQSIWFVNYSALEKMDSLDAMEGNIIHSHAHAHTQSAHAATHAVMQIKHGELFNLVVLVGIGDVELEWEETTM